MMRYWQILADQRRPLKFLLSRLIMRTGVSDLLTIRKQGFEMGFHPTSLTASLWVDPEHRDNLLHGGFEEHFIRRYLRPGDSVVDIGANVGLTTLAAAATVGPHGHVIAVEGHPRIFYYLYRNVARNHMPYIRLVLAALGDRDGAVSFSNHQSDDYNAVVLEPTPLQVRMRRLDDLDLPPGPIALIKLDVEGFELPVLIGGCATLERTACLYFESCAEHFARYGYTCGDLFAFLAGQGLRVYKLHERRLLPVPQEYSSKRYENLVAVRDPLAFATRMEMILCDALAPDLAAFSNVETNASTSVG